MPEVWAVSCAASTLMARPCSVMSPPLPLPLVSAVINPWPKIDRFLAEVPSLIVPPRPPPAAVSSVAALMRELPEKAIARSRGVLALRLIAPAFPVLVALVLSWEPSEKVRLAASTVMRPPVPLAVVFAETSAPFLMLMEEPLRLMLPPSPKSLVSAVM